MSEYCFTSYGGRTIQVHKLVWLREHNFEEIPKGFIIHHIDGNKKNNKIENLELLSNKEHGEKHRKVCYMVDSCKSSHNQTKGSYNLLKGSHNQKILRKQAQTS